MFLDALSKLSPVATGLVAIIALIVGISTIRQKLAVFEAAITDGLTRLGQPESVTVEDRDVGDNEQDEEATIDE